MIVYVEYLEEECASASIQTCDCCVGKVDLPNIFKVPDVGRAFVKCCTFRYRYDPLRVRRLRRSTRYSLSLYIYTRFIYALLTLYTLYTIHTT